MHHACTAFAGLCNGSVTICQEKRDGHMKRYYMSASNGAVVAHESETGEWVEFEESQAGVVRRIDRLEERIKELEAALEPIRGVWKRYDDYPMFGPSGAEYAEAVKRCMEILEGKGGE